MTTTRSRRGCRLPSVVAAALVAGGLVAFAPAPVANADSQVTSASLSWGFKQSFRTYVGNQTAALPPLGAAPVADRINTLSPATFDPAVPAVATTADEAKRPYTFPATSGTVTSATAITVPTSGGVVYKFPSHHFEVTLENLKVVVAGSTATIYADTTYVADEAFGDRPAGTIEETQVALATSSALDVQVQAKTASVTATNVTLTADGAEAIPLYPAGEALDGFTLSTNQQDPPAVDVSQTEVSPNGSTVVTVNGSGFTPAGSIGTRPPLSGQQAGVYVVFGKFNPTWRPSSGAASSTRTAATVANGGQRWALPAAAHATVGGAGAGAVALNPDGSFTAKIRISKSQIDAAAAGTPANTQYGIYTYPGSGANAPTQETYTPITFTAASTNVALDAAGYTGTQGTPLAVTATITHASVAGTPSGNARLVTFAGDGIETVVETKALSGGQATFTVPDVPGSGALVVRYDGDGTFPAADSSPAAYTVKVGSQVAFSSPAYSPSAGATTPFTVSVAKPATVAAPTGNVVVTSTPTGGSPTAVGTVTLTAAMNGVASFTLPALPQGATGTLSASYAGNAAYAGGSASATYAVAGNTATVSLDKAAYTGTTGTPVPVEIAVAGGAGTPTGSVVLTYTPAGGTATALPAADLDGSGKATVDLPASLGAGSGAISVSYAGDGTYQPGTATATYTLAKKASSLAVVGPAVVAYRTAATYTATVTHGTGQVKITGAGVTYYRPIVAGTATFVLPATLPAGARTLRFEYLGDADTAAAAASPKAVTIAKGATTVTAAVTKKWTAAKAGALTVRIASVKGGPAPVGKVGLTLRKGSVTKTVGARLLAGGKVVLALPRSAKGTWSVKVTYAGSTQHAAATRTWRVKVRAR